MNYIAVADLRKSYKLGNPLECSAKQFLLRDHLFIPQKIGNTATIYSRTFQTILNTECLPSNNEYLIFTKQH